MERFTSNDFLSMTYNQCKQNSGSSNSSRYIQIQLLLAQSIINHFRQLKPSFMQKPFQKKSFFACFFCHLVMAAQEKKPFRRIRFIRKQMKTIILLEAFRSLKAVLTSKKVQDLFSKPIHRLWSIAFQLFLKKRQLEAQITALTGRKPNIPTQFSSSRSTAKNCESGANRINNLAKQCCHHKTTFDWCNGNMSLWIGSTAFVRRKSNSWHLDSRISTIATPMEGAGSRS